MNSLIIVAAGKGTRLGREQNKLLLSFRGKPLIQTTLEQVATSRCIEEAVIVTRREERPFFVDIVKHIDFPFPVRFADGGKERLDSVRKGMAALSSESTKVLIHDGARPFVDGGAMDHMLEVLSDDIPAAVYGIPIVDTVKEVVAGEVLRTKDRTKLFRIQTPQGFLTKVYRSVLGRENAIVVTDDASLAEQAGVSVRLLVGKSSYFKVTTPEDWEKYTDMVDDTPMIRIGQGYDIHRIAEDRPLILGGVRMAETKGLVGHSDADVLLHALMDALLGAAGLPDIGHHFPDTDEAYKDADSVQLLSAVKGLIESEYVIGNIDTTIIAEAPKMGPYIPAMKEKIAGILDIQVHQISIKASTNEKLGALGRQEGIAALASVLLQRRKSDEKTI